MNKKNIFLLGATDRNNYGDLLFPHIIANYLKQNVDFSYSISNYATVNSDLSKLGAFKTHGYRCFLKDIKRQDNVSIILVGGEVLGADWIKLISFINPIVHFGCQNKLFDKKIFRRLFRLIIIPKEKRVYPFLIDKREFPKLKHVFYSCVGGALPKDIQQSVQFDLFSVRTKRDYENLKYVENLEVIPDSAILMSDFWSLSVLSERVSSEVKNIELNNYVFFQVNKEAGSSNIDSIVAQLTELYNNTGLSVVLCPIGKALGHHDQLSLKQINKKLKIPHFYFNSPTIWDIMFLIAKSQLYIGTSLHGVITAMSFNVPYLGIQRENMKIQKYLDDWGIDVLAKSVHVADFYSRANYVLNDDLTLKLSNSSEQMKSLVYNYLHRIAKIINDD